jgi:multiple sugar transport system ATP-binding protein
VARIELRHLRKTFGGGIEAVKDLDLVIEEGEFLVLVGPSGCGKTTTLRMIAGFEEPTSGEIWIDGRMVNDVEPGQRNLGMVFQNLALFPHRTVAENIEFGPHKVERETRRRRVLAVAAMVKITHLLDKLPGQCSGGEAQRVALARTLITEPSTFLLDEPLSNLDAKLRRETRAAIDRLHQTVAKTFIYVTHDQEEAMTLADRIAVMRDGRLEQVGTPLDIYNNPVSVFVADFFGSPSMNLIPGSIISPRNGPHFQGLGRTLALSGRALARAALGWEFPLSTLSIVVRVPRPTMTHVSSRPPLQCRTVGFPQYGFKRRHLAVRSAAFRHGLRTYVCSLTSLRHTVRLRQPLRRPSTSQAARLCVRTCGVARLP